jgi:hypothetical protein
MSMSNGKGEQMAFASELFKLKVSYRASDVTGWGKYTIQWGFSNTVL